MRSSKLAGMFLGLVLATAFAAAALGGERGSGGTTGGGDNLISVYALLPQTLEIKARYDYPKRRYTPSGELLWENTMVGWKPWLGGGRTIWANELELAIRFNLELFIRDPEGVPLYLTAVEGRSGQPLFQSHTVLFRDSLLVQPTVGRAIVRKLRLETVDDVNEDRAMKWETLDPFEITISWDAKPISVADLTDRLTTIEETLFSQLSLDDADSIRNVALFDRFRRMLSLPGVEGRFGKILYQRIKAEKEEITALAAASRKTGTCDIAQYRQLLSKYRAWETGSPEHLRRLRDNLQFQLSSRVDQRAAELRESVLQSVMETMLVCDEAKREALNLILNRQ